MKAMEFPVLLAFLLCTAYPSGEAKCEAGPEENRPCFTGLVDYCITQRKHLHLKDLCTAACFWSVCGTAQTPEACCDWLDDGCRSPDTDAALCGKLTRTDCFNDTNRYNCPKECSICPSRSKRRLNGVRFIGTDNVLKMIYL